MPTTFAEINSRIMFGLGDLPTEWLDAPDVHSAAVQCLNVRKRQARLSANNVTLSVSDTFTASSEPVDISDLIEDGSVAWAEYYADGSWKPIRSIPFTDLEDYRKRGIIAYALWGEDDGDDETVRYIQFTYQPSGSIRLLYDRDQTKQRISDILDIPDELTELIVLEAQNKLIPRIKLKAAMNLNRNEQARQDIAPILQILDGVYQQNMIDIQPLAQLFRVYAFAPQGTQKSFTKPTPTGASLYNDRRGGRYPR